MVASENACILNGLSRSSKVVDFDQSKARMQLPVIKSNQIKIKYLLLMTDKRNHSSWKKNTGKNGDTHNTYEHNKLC